MKQSNQLNVYSLKAVSKAAPVKARAICKIIGNLNRLFGIQYRKGIIDPVTQEALSKAFRDLNRWRAIGKWVLKNFDAYVSKGMKYIDESMGKNAVRLDTLATEDDAVEVSDRVFNALWGIGSSQTPISHAV